MFISSTIVKKRTKIIVEKAIQTQVTSCKDVVYVELEDESTSILTAEEILFDIQEELLKIKSKISKKEGKIYIAVRTLYKDLITLVFVFYINENPAYRSQEYLSTRAQAEAVKKRFNKVNSKIKWNDRCTDWGYFNH